jgi:hypothetical protein
MSSECEMTGNFQRSLFRDVVLELIAAAPPNGTPISAVLALPGAGSRDCVDHLLARMVLAGEIVRCGRGRYGVPGRRRAQPAIETTPASAERAAVASAYTRGEPAATRRERAHAAEEVLAEKLGLCRHEPTAVDFAELDSFCATVGCLCTKYGLSPPFRLRDLVVDWVSGGISLAHCLRTIEDYLVAHAAKCRSGSTDRLFGWIDTFLRGGHRTCAA